METWRFPVLRTGISGKHHNLQTPEVRLSQQQIDSLEGAKIVTEVGSLGTSSEHTKTPREYRTRVMYTVESRGHEQSKGTNQIHEDSIGGTHTC